MEREDTSGNEMGGPRSERGTPEGSFEDSNGPEMEMEESETGRRTSIFKYYAYRDNGKSDLCR